MMLMGVAMKDQPETPNRTMHHPAMTRVLDKIRVQESDRDGQPFECCDRLELTRSNGNTANREDQDEKQVTRAGVSAGNMHLPVVFPVVRISAHG